MLILIGLISSQWGFSAENVVKQSILDELREKAIPAWISVEQDFKSIDVLYRGTYRTGKSNQAKVSEITNFRLVYDAGRQVSFLRRHDDGTPKKIVHDVANSKYDFNVFSPDSISRCTLSLLNIATIHDSGDARENGLPTWHHRLNLLAACRVGPMPLSEMLDPNLFTLSEAADDGVGGQRRIRFAAVSKKREQEGAIYHVTLDPTHHYRVTETLADFPPQRPVQSTSHFEYFDNDEVFIPRKCTFTTSGNGYFAEQEYTYEVPRPCTVSDAEFHLPHYGISESVLETLNPNPWPRWFLVMGGVMTLLVGVWLFRKSHPGSLGDAS